MDLVDDDSTSKEYPAAAVTEKNETDEALQGYVLDPGLYPDNAAGLKTTKDGRFVLIPQPLDTPDDPLNWSSRKKTLILIIIAYIAFLADYSGSTTIVAVIPQATEWHKTQVIAQRPLIGNIFTIASCGLIVVALASYFGRLPVTLFFQIVFFASSIWSASASSYNSYLASRIINGLFCSVGQGGVLMWIKDMYFFHEQTRAINYIELTIILSPYLGPMIEAFILSGGLSWRVGLWIVSGLAGLAVVLTCFLDETLFDRSIPAEKRVPRGPRLGRLFGIEQAKSLPQRSFLQSALRPIVAITKIPVLLTMIYNFLNFAWVIGLNTTVSIFLTNYYHFTPKSIGFFYFFGIVGPIIGWLLGHWMHDWFGRAYARRHKGHIDPEARLIIAYPATILIFVSLIVCGFALEHLWHFMYLAVFSAVQAGAILVITTAISAYLLNAYPEGSGEVAAWVSASRNWSGFMSTYIQIEWVNKAGPAKVFGIQAAITAASVLLIIFLQFYGRRLRQMQGRMVFGSDK